MARLRAVFDASVLLRAAVEGDADALAWISRVELGDVEARAPGLIWAEVTHALTRYVRTNVLSPAQAQERSLWLLRLPLQSEPLEPLAAAALPVALTTGLSASDACYLALARAADGVLITADQRLADAAPNAVLLA